MSPSLFLGSQNSRKSGSAQEIRCHRQLRYPHYQTLRSPWYARPGLYSLPFFSLLIASREDHLIPMDSRVEIDAKIAAGYFTSGKQITQADLVKTVGRTWEETEH